MDHSPISRWKIKFERILFLLDRISRNLKIRRAVANRSVTFERGKRPRRFFSLPLSIRPGRGDVGFGARRVSGRVSRLLNR